MFDRLGYPGIVLPFPWIFLMIYIIIAIYQICTQLSQTLLKRLKNKGASKTMAHYKGAKRLPHKWIYWRAKYLANCSVIVAGITLIWRKAVVNIPIIAMNYNDVT